MLCLIVLWGFSLVISYSGVNFFLGLINVLEFFETWQQPTEAALAVK